MKYRLRLWWDDALRVVVKKFYTREEAKPMYTYG